MLARSRRIAKRTGRAGKNLDVHQGKPEIDRLRL